MKKNGTLSIALVAGIAASIGGVAHAGVPGITTERVVSGLTRPIYVTYAPGDFDRIYIIEKQGIIKVHQFSTNTTSVFMNIDALVGGGTSTNDERGLLGLAFHPDFQNNGYFYVNYTDTTGSSADSVVSRFSATSPDTGDAGSELIVMRYFQPFSNHNGGWIGFGPNDGYLYISTGDGGSANDPGDRSQDITDQPLGKMLRIDVDGTGGGNAAYAFGGLGGNYGIPSDNPFVGVTGDDEIFHYGLRNAWRSSFDRQTGDFWIADVGQNAIEEVNFQLASSAGGVNYGWSCREGNSAFIPGRCDSGDILTPPIHTYTHGGSPFRCSITGGYVYRGCAIPGLEGTYFFADYCSEQIWTFSYNPISGLTGFTDRTNQLDPAGALSIDSITSFGEDAFGEIYIVDQGGEIFKIVPVRGVASDCDNNGIEDACQIAMMPGLDADNNGVLDSCETPCFDVTGDNNVDLSDLNVLLSSFGVDDGGDVDGDGDTDLQDLNAVLGAFGTSC